MNSYVIGKYGSNSNRTEEDVFLEYVKEKMGMNAENAHKFRVLCQKIPEAVLRGRYVEAYDKHLNEEIMPSELWLRDDRMAGLRQLNVMFEYLEEHHLLEAAMAERDTAIELWEDIREEFQEIDVPDSNLKEFIENSIEYAIRFFTITKINFHIFAKCRKQESVKELLKEYDEAWNNFKELEKRSQASTSYCEKYIFSPDNLGLNETIAYCRTHLNH